MNMEEPIESLAGTFLDLACWREYHCGINIIKFNDSSDPLPPYVPQVGIEYFSKENMPKILMYGMNQNLQGSPDIVASYTELRKDNRDRDIVRRLDGVNEKGITNVELNIGPYPHLNMLARLLIYILRQEVISYNTVFNLTATTNLIKCSTTWGPSTPNITMYGNCARKTCLAEIEVLEPTIILAMGREVFESLTHTLQYSEDENLPGCSTPGHGYSGESTPRLIISCYHATGPIRSSFKALQNFFEGGGKTPRAFRPFLKMLTGESVTGSSSDWDLAKEKYDKCKELFESRFVDFFKKGSWYGQHRDYLCYFACHYEFMKKVLESYK